MTETCAKCSRQPLFTVNYYAPLPDRERDQPVCGNHLTILLREMATKTTCRHYEVRVHEAALITPRQRARLRDG